MGFFPQDTVHLAALLRIILAPHRTLLGGHRCTADGSRKDRLKGVPCFLSSSVVDVVQPLSPKKEGCKRLRRDTAVLQESPGSDLIDGRYRLRLEYPFILQPGLMQGSKTIKVGVGVLIPFDQFLKQVQEINSWQTERIQ